MVLDTACQRSCAGERWFATHTKLLQNHGLSSLHQHCQDRFQFGAGGAQTAAERCYMPASFRGQETQGVLFGVSILPLPIPFLASRVLLEGLGCVIDLQQNVLHMSKLGVSVPIVRKHGHIVACITAFPPFASELPCWNELFDQTCWDKKAPELVLHPEAVSAQSNSILGTYRAHAQDQASSRMVGSLENSHSPVAVARAQRDEEHEPVGEVGHPPTVLAYKCRTPGVEGDAAQGTHQAKTGQEELHTPRVPPLRQHTRPVLDVSPLRGKVQVEHGARRLGGVFSKVLQLLGAAATIISQYPLTHGFGSQDNGNQEQAAAQEQAASHQDIQYYFQPELQDPRSNALRHVGGEFQGQRLHQGRVRGHHELSEPGSIPSGFGRSGHLPTAVGRGMGVVNDENQPEHQDYWEKIRLQCIRHHILPRLLLHNLSQDSCPVPRHLIHPQCQAHIHYEDGTFETITYDWTSDKPQQLRQPWTGRTIYTIQHVQNRPVGPLTNAARRSLRTQVRQAHKVYETEYAIMSQSMDDKYVHEHLRKHKHQTPRVDILETFAGTANISKRCHEFNLTAAEPIDYNTRWDLRKPAHRDRVPEILDVLRPIVLIQGIDCRDWCLLQDNCNYVRRKILLLMRRAKARVLLRKVAAWCRQQHQQGRCFLIENPLTSRLWQEQCIQDLTKLDGVQSTVCHAGAYGATNSKGQMIRKAHRFMGNCEPILRRLTKKLTPHQLQSCAPLEGKETTLSQVYPKQMVTVILQGVKEEAQARHPDRGHPKQTFQIHMVTTISDWAEAIGLAESTFQVTRYKNFTLPTSDPLFTKAAQLTQWDQLERVQISWQPMVWRFPSHIPHTHRAAALKYTDGEIEVFEEDLKLLRHPRARFKKPVQLAIFMFGHVNEPPPEAKRPRLQGPQQPDIETPPDSSQPSMALQPQPIQQRSPDYPLQIIPRPAEDITFPQHIKLPAEIKLAVRRLHKNMGHPRPAELKKLLGMNGVRNQTIYTAIDNMKCNSCERTKGPSRPDPGGGIPDEAASQFADRIQMDIMYVRDIRGVNHMILGIIDEVTHLHIGALLKDRTPEEVNRQFQLAWARPFGYPLRLRTDPDGSFRSTFEEAMDEAGVYIDYIPAEAHHKIGLIERHNATYREIMERVIDSQGISGPDQMEILTAMTSHAKNSCTWSTGRPPYIAAFGRIPRQGLDLLNDPNGLVTGQTRSHAQQFADTIRAEAQQHIAAMAVDSSLRRALLRNTQPQNSDIPEIGATVAYWRWTARSGKKRGGYKLARLLGRDPDGKSMWLQAGTNTIRVAPHQLRIARGFECWNPDYQQIKELRTAADNLHQGLLRDESIPEPPEDPDQPLGTDMPEEPVDIPTSGIPFLVPPPATETTEQKQRQPQEHAEEAVQTDPYGPPVSQQVEYHLNVHSPTYNKTVIQTQSHFGMTPEQWMEPPVNAPVRRQHRSRTPGGRRPRDRSIGPPTPAAPELEDAPGPGPYTPRHALPHAPPLPEQADPQSALTPSQQPGTTEVIDVDKLPDSAPSQPHMPHLENIAPTTPPDLVQETSSKRTSSEMEQPIPAQRTYKALVLKHTRQQRLTPSAYILHGYHRMATSRTPADQTLRVWARRDVSSQTLQTTHLTGPPKRCIQHRRVLALPSGEVLWDAPFSDAQDGLPISPVRTDMVTELWYEPETQWPHQSNLVITPDGMTQQPDHHDGSEDVCLPYTAHMALRAYRTTTEYMGTGESSDSDASADDMTKGHQGHVNISKAGSSQTLTRQQQKALDKELPWQAILQMGEEAIQQFVESARAEEKSWQRFNSVLPLSQKEADKVLQDPQLRRRILKARAAYRDKSKGQGQLRAKTRVVALGHLDPDLHELSRESATPMRQSEHVLYALFVSGHNHLLLDGKDAWVLWTGDVKTAFLQGEPDPRKLPLFLSPPTDGITKRAGTFRSPLYKIVGNIYGLASAPKTWTNHVTKTLLSAGFRQHTLDKMLFVLYAKLPGTEHEMLVAALIAYVDDFLLVHNERWDRSALTSLFEWGSKEVLTLDNSIVFKGKELSLRQHGNQTYLALTQKAFIEGMKVGSVQCKKRLTETILPEDLPELRSVAGCLQWLSGQTRPDVSAVVSLSSRGANATYQNLYDMYLAVEHLHATKDQGVCIWPVAINLQTMVVNYSDSSWANAAGSASQHGNLLLLAEPKAVDTVSTGMLLDWKSSRSARICRSTLSAEASACDTGIDRASFLAYLLTEILMNEASFKLSRTLRIISVTDCRSLYDVLCSENPRTEDKRTIVVIRGIQQHVSREQVFWVPTHLQWSDSLTKISEKLVEGFMSWLKKPWIQLREAGRTHSSQQNNTNVNFSLQFHDST